ncbi:MAG TPA: hypothetical protein VM432_04065 [Bdellovibrionales bacterium]|nr:hypothetical protein [Bdellovibrionales bacterium]
MKNLGAFEWTKSWARIRNIIVDANKTLESTNLRAKEADLPALPIGEAVGPIHLTLADVQTAGRGRAQNTWVSAPGALLSSWSARLAKPPQPILSPLVGLAVFQSLDRTFPGLPVSLKAPNDIYLGEKKLAGILIENIVAGNSVRTIVGLGMNVFAKPETIDATSLMDYVGEEDLIRLWPRFLEAWFSELRAALTAGQADSLEHSARYALCTALNRFPLLDEPIVEVDERGQIRSASRAWFWHEL